jgi:hypothetical protein
MNFDGGVYLDMAYEGALEQRASVEFNVANHPKLQLPQLAKDDTQADVLWAREGWFDIYASAEIQVDAWIKYYENPMMETTGHSWTRSLPVQPSSFIRKDAWFPIWDYKLAPR